MEKLLVPCDFSMPAIQAFQFALDVAGMSDTGTVHLLHVIELPVLHDTTLMPVLAFEETFLKEIKEKAEDQLAVLERKLNRNKNKVVMTVQLGSVSDIIRRYADDHAIETIIMGSHGASGMRELFLGSNAERIVRHARVPVLVIKGPFKGPIKNIVFPNTLEVDDQEGLVRKVKALQHFFGAHLHIVWINTPMNFTSDTVTLARLQKFAERFQFKNYTINIFNHSNTEEGILDFAKSIDATLIAMGTHGRTGLSHLIHGSITESLVNHGDKLIWSYVMKEQVVDV